MSSSKGLFHLLFLEAVVGTGGVRGSGLCCLAVTCGEMEEGQAAVQTVISGTDHWQWNFLHFLFKDEA